MKQEEETAPVDVEADRPPTLEEQTAFAHNIYMIKSEVRARARIWEGRCPRHFLTSLDVATTTACAQTAL